MVLFTLLLSRREGSLKTFRTIYVWIIVLLHSFSKRKIQEVQSPRAQDLLGVPTLFWRSLQQKSDSHWSRSNPCDHLSFSAPFTSESLFYCTLFPKGKTKKLRVQGPNTSWPHQNYSENRCNKRVIHTALEPTRRILWDLAHHSRLNHCFVALYF
jgi:hypothetical protein